MDNKKHIFGFILLIIVLLTFIIGGYMLMNYMITSENEEKEENIKEDIRIDKTKDYVYYENEEMFLQEEDIIKKDIVLNFKKLADYNNKLKAENEKLFSNIKYIKDQKIDAKTEYQENTKGYYSFNFRNYFDYTYDKYISILMLDYKYDVIKGVQIDNISSKIINKKTGDFISEEELMNKFKISEEDIINSIKKRLEDTQVLNEEDNVIDIDKTINEFKKSNYSDGNKALILGKDGKIIVNFIVKSNQIDYNDSVEVK